MHRSVLLIFALLAESSLRAEEAAPAPVAGVMTPAPVEAPADLTAGRYTLVEEFTAQALAGGELKIGTDLDLGLGGDVMIGTDIVALAVGATTLSAKAKVYDKGAHAVALGLRAAYLSKNTLLWGSVNEHFDELDARILRPQIAWTHTLSSRLKLHTFWAKGFGRIRARLSEKGRRKLWETKHPGANYEDRDKETQHPDESPTEPAAEPGDPEGGSETDTSNQERDAAEQSSLTSQSIQVQSITGLAQERFQLTGEFTRQSGNKILISSRIEETQFEDLKSNFFRLTAAHQWIWASFQMRLGVGLQYYVLSGNDLDGEEIDDSGVQPASDIAFYWRL